MQHRRNEADLCADPSALQFLDVSSVATARTVEFHPSEALTSGSSRRAAQAIRLVRSMFRKALNCSIEKQSLGIAIVCSRATETEVRELCRVVEERLADLRNRPLTAKMVEEILSITAVERLRWSKDGRIPTAGHAFFGQGKKQVRLFEYAPAMIRDLAARPATIAEWRQSGAQE